MKIFNVSSVKLPNMVLAKATSKSHAHRSLVNHAITKGLTPIPPEPDETITLSINIHPDLQAKIELVAERYEMTFSGVFAGLANAGLQSMETHEKRDKKQLNSLKEGLEKMLLVGPNDEIRPQQQKFWLNLASGLAMDKVTLAEASTGVGKGKAIISAAIMSVKNGKYPVLIASPLVKGIAQLWEEYEKPFVKKGAEGISVAFLPGKQEFVDDVLLQKHLLDNPDQAVSEWIEAGAPNKVASALSGSAEMGGIKLCWLMDDLREIATNLRAEDFALSDKTPPEAEGLKQLNAIRQYASKAQIVFLTQAMLIRISKAWSLLPEINKTDDSGERVNNPVIIIDEAHLFEETASSALSHDLSLFSLRSRMIRAIKENNIGKGTIVARAVKAVNELMNICKANYDGNDIVLTYGVRGKPLNNSALKLRDDLKSKLNDVKSLLSSKGKVKSVVGINNDISTITEIINTINKDLNNRISILYSPERKFPVIQVGPSSVKKDLSRIWNTASGGVGLVSATFFLPSWDGGMRSDYMRDSLSLPLARIATPNPVIWPEIYSSPVLHLPNDKSAGCLVPPDDDSAEKLDKWAKEQAETIFMISESARGGMLCLCTSYAQVGALQRHLISKGIAEQRLIANSGRLRDDQKKYIEVHDNGDRPIWLVLGPGWAGLDLVQKDEKGIPVEAKNDTLLTDLVLTRIPLGLNRSVSMQAKIEYSFRPVLQEALLKFKQGLGRIIRRGGLLNRRIWILDGRVSLKPKSIFMAELVSGLYMLMDGYKKRKLF